MRLNENWKDVLAVSSCDIRAAFFSFGDWEAGDRHASGDDCPLVIPLAPSITMLLPDGGTEHCSLDVTELNTCLNVAMVEGDGTPRNGDPGTDEVTEGSTGW